MMPTYEGLRLKVLSISRKTLCKIREKTLKQKDFSIISNNCWAGKVYEYYNLQKHSPTVGLFFMADDYIRFLKRLPEYLKTSLTFIKPVDSKYKFCPQVSNDKRFGSYPIARLILDHEDVEVFFLHYLSEDEARNKWHRRCCRVNFDKLLIKFNDQNGCTEEHVKTFISLPFKNKIFFTVKRWGDENKYCEELKGNYFVVKQSSSANNNILASYEPFGKRITIILNAL